MTGTAGRLVVGCAALFAATSCTYIIESNTIELSDKIDALTQRLEKIEKANTAAEVDALKQNVAQIASYLQNASARRRGAQPQQPGGVAQAQPRPQPQPRQQPPARQEPPTRQPREGRQGRQPGGRPQVSAAERAVRRAAYIAGRADLSEEQASALARVLQLQQERFMSLSQAVREGRVAKEDVDAQRENVRAQTQNDFDAFLATVNEDQKAMVLKALQPRKKAGGAKKKGGRPARQPKPKTKRKAKEGGE